MLGVVILMDGVFARLTVKFRDEGEDENVVDVDEDDGVDEVKEVEVVDAAIDEVDLEYLELAEALVVDFLAEEVCGLAILPGGLFKRSAYLHFDAMIAKATYPTQRYDSLHLSIFVHLQIGRAHV